MHSLREHYDFPELDTLPVEACWVGEDAAKRLAEFAGGRCGQKALVVADANTREADGEQVLTELGLHHKQLVEHTFPAAPLDATDSRAQEVAKAGADCDFYVAVGSGTLCDLAKSAGSEQGKPVLLYATAASMNGYTSAIVALKVRGLKRTIPCQPATGVFADPRVVATAPPRMAAAGFADFMSKATSVCDWRAAHVLREEAYSERPRAFTKGIEGELISKAAGLPQGDAQAMQLLLDALMLSGFGMIVAGSSAPASGGEHLLSHYIDMKDALYGTGHDLHGAQVGVGTVYCLGLWERVLSLSVDDMDFEALIGAQPSEEEVEAWVYEDWGDAVAAEVLDQWAQKRHDPYTLAAELQRIEAELPRLRGMQCEDLIAPGILARAIEDAGGPRTPAALAAPAAEFEKAKKRARFLRNRFTVLDLAAEVGVG